MQEARLFLQSLLRVSSEELEQALTGGYIIRYIPKRNGSGRRKISVPSEELKFVQKRILRDILYRIKAPHFFYGFVRGKSIMVNAAWHEYKNIPEFFGLATMYFLKLDLKDAFPSVKEKYFREYADQLLAALPDFLNWRQTKLELLLHHRINRESWRFGWKICPTCDQLEGIINKLEKKNKIDFRNLRLIFRYFSKNSELFSREHKNWLKGVSTDSHQLGLFENCVEFPVAFEIFIRDVFELLFKLCFHEGSLPQGAPTSPYLLNLTIWFSGMTSRLEKLQKKTIGIKGKAGYDFSIYADDLTFSAYFSFGARPFASDGNLKTVKQMIIETVEEDGHFKINFRKTRSYNSMKCHPLITGLRVVHNRIVLPKIKIRWLRSFFHHVKNNPDPKVQAQVQGWRSYLHMIYEDDLPKQIVKMIS